MNRLVFGHDASVAEWASEKLEKADFQRILSAVGIINHQGELSGAGVLHHHSRFDVELSGVGEITHTLFKALLHIAFINANVERVTVRVPRRNKKVLRVTQKYGFQHEGVQRRLYGPHKADDCVVFGLLRKDADRYLKVKS